MSRDEDAGEQRERRVRKKRSRRARHEVHTPRVSFEELEIHTSDGAVLRAVMNDPPEGSSLRATLILAHAMFARKSTFGRPDRRGLGDVLGARGYRTLAFDFRGHGESRPPKANPEWGYDDFVRFDMPAVVDCARARGEGKPILVVGHSLGGHVALAAEGAGYMHA